MMNKLLEISFGRQPSDFESQVAEHFFNQGMKAAETGRVEFKPVAALLGGKPKEFKRVDRFVKAGSGEVLTQSEAMRMKMIASQNARMFQEAIVDLRYREKAYFKLAEKGTMQGQIAFKLLNETRDQIRELRKDLELINSAIRHFRSLTK
jgi:hypothetical protein